MKARNDEIRMTNDEPVGGFWPLPTGSSFVIRASSFHGSKNADQEGAVQP
jgi:hypothetical protein